MTVPHIDHFPRAYVQIQDVSDFNHSPAYHARNASKTQPNFISCPSCSISIYETHTARRGAPALPRSRYPLSHNHTPHLTPPLPPPWPNSHPTPSTPPLPDSSNLLPAILPPPITNWTTVRFRPSLRWNSVYKSGFELWACDKIVCRYGGSRGASGVRVGVAGRGED